MRQISRRAIATSVLSVMIFVGANSVIAAMFAPLFISQSNRTQQASKNGTPKPQAAAADKGANQPAKEKPSSAGVKTDYKIYPEPEPPKLPPAGETFADPVFGTTILRVTDASDGDFNANNYSYWPSFNKDSTLLFLITGGKPTLYSFDPVLFRTFDKRPLFVVKPVVGSALTAEDAIWSGVEPEVIYGHDGMRLWSYHVSNKKYTLEKDFVRQLGSGNLHQMSRSIDDNVFAFTIKDKNYKIVGYAVWRRDTDAVTKFDATADLDEVQIDKSGRYLVVKTGKSGKGVVRVKIVDLQTNKVEDLIDGSPDYAPGHSDNGTGMLIGGDNWQNRFNYRKLASPHQFHPVIEMGNDWTIGSHISLLADDESWMLMSTFKANDLPSTGLFRDELLLIATDGSKRVRRLAHLHSAYREYWDTPRANISRDGKFAVFTSNWGSPGHRDVFVVRIPPEEKR